jgi:hypothetical protein
MLIHDPTYDVGEFVHDRPHQTLLWLNFENVGAGLIVPFHARSYLAREPLRHWSVGCVGQRKRPTTPSG